MFGIIYLKVMTNMATSTFDKKIIIDEKAADVIIDSLKNPTVVDDSKVRKVLEELEKSKTKLAELSSNLFVFE